MSETSESRGATLARLIAIDVFAWCCMPVAFLYIYVNYHAFSSAAVGAHLRLVLAAFFGLTIVRLALYRLIRNRHIARFTFACIMSAAFALMTLYYVLVLVGLHSWARVISWDLITTYTTQLPELLNSLGLSIHYVLALSIVFYASLTYAALAYIRGTDWTPLILHKISGHVHLIVTLAGFGVCAIVVHHFIFAPPTEKYEPLSLTFFPLTMARDLQGHAIDNRRAAKLDQLQDAARSAYGHDSGTHKKNLVLVVVDALRPDHMGVYGYHRDTTPNITRLLQSQQGRVVTNVRASCGDSSCGLLSLASSKFLYEFSNKPFTLQQALRRQGYRVEMILGGDHTSFYGLKDMYGEVDSYFDGSMARGYYANDDELVLDHVERLPAWDKKPVMMQFHLMSSHVLGKRHDRFAKYSPAENYMLPANRGPSSSEKVINFYDNGVVQADAVIFKLLTILQTKGYLKEALVVITADHGEALGEHGIYAHANSVREAALRIPLVFLPYGYQTRLDITSKKGYTQTDIAPTILADFGLAIPRSWSGYAIQGGQQRQFSYFQEGQAAGLLDHRDPENLWKYWLDAKDGAEYAFNLTRDPAENDNLIKDVPPRLKSEWRLQQIQLMPRMRGGVNAMVDA